MFLLMVELNMCFLLGFDTSLTVLLRVLSLSLGEASLDVERKGRLRLLHELQKLKRSEMAELKEVGSEVSDFC